MNRNKSQRMSTAVFEARRRKFEKPPIQVTTKKIIKLKKDEEAAAALESKSKGTFLVTTFWNF